MKLLNSLRTAAGSRLLGKAALDSIKAKAIAASSYLDSHGWKLRAGTAPGWLSSSCDSTDLSTVDQERSYGRHPVVRGCVNMLSNSAPVPELQLGMEIQGEWQEVKGPHPVKELLLDPNPESTFREIIKAMVARWTLTGFGYIVKIRSRGGGGVAALVAVPTSMVTPVRNSQGLDMVSGYEITGQDRVFPPEDVIVMRDLDPATMDGATSMFGAAERDYALDIERFLYQNDMLHNLKVPGTVINMGTHFDPKRVEELRAKWNLQFGNGNRADPLFISGDGSVEILNPLEKLDYPGLTSLAETRICTAFGVSPILLQTRAGLDRAVDSNFESAIKMLYGTSMIPIWLVLGETLTRGLLRSEGESQLELRFMYKDLEQFQEDKTATSTRAVSQYNAGVAMKNEARNDVGLDEIGPEGDEFKATLAGSLGGQFATPDDGDKGGDES